MMNNTALRAGAQSANNTHMVFANEEHEKFYYEKLEQARYQGWQTSGSVKVVRLAFNLYTDGMPSVDDNESRDEQVSECKPNLVDWVGYIRKRHFLLRLCTVFLAGHSAPLPGILPETAVY